MRARLSAPLALIALMGSPVMAAPVAAPPPPPVPPAPPSLESSAASAGTLVIPKTCLDHLAIIGGPETRLVSGSGRLTHHADRLTFTTSAADCTKETDAVVMVPARTGIEIQMPHDRATTYRITGVNGDLTATTGRGNLDVDQVSGLTLTMGGSGDVSVGHADGRISVKDFSSGDLHIGSIAASGADLTTMSSGDIQIDQGNADVLTVRNYGSADITLNGTVRDADLTLMGSGDIVLDRVTDTLKKRALGSGSITVDETSGARITTLTTPDTSAVLSDTLKDVLNQSHVEFHFGDAETASSHTSHHSGGHGVIGLLLKIFLIVWLVRFFRRYRKTGIVPFRKTVDRAAAGYAAGVRSWSQRDPAWRETPAAGVAAVVKNAVQGFRGYQPALPEDFSHSVPPGHPLAQLQDRLLRMERRIGLMEQFVTSPDFSLERQFRELERTDGRRA